MPSPQEITGELTESFAAKEDVLASAARRTLAKMEEARRIRSILT
jgi:hypothetical protein